MLFVLIVSKNLNKDMKFFSHFSLQFKNIILILHRQKQTMGYGVMVTLQILVLSFLVRIQVAQLKTIFARRSFFFVFYAWREMFVPHILRCWVSATMQASAPTQHRMEQVPLSPLYPTLSIVVPPDSHFCLVEPI